MQMRNRTRRLRSTSTLRNLVAEVNLNLNKFIEPLFLLDPNHTNDVLPITSMPGIARRKLKPMKEYIKMITDAGFGTIEIRAKYLYRILSPNHYDCKENIRIDSIEICAIKDPMPEDGPCIFTGKSAVYVGKEEYNYC